LQSPSGRIARAAFERFWAAESPAAAARLVDDIVKTGVTFDDAYRTLKQGRTYTSGVIVDYRPQPEAGHNTRWWPEVKDGWSYLLSPL